MVFNLPEEGHHHSRARSVDSLEAGEEDEEEELQPATQVKKKKHKSGEGTSPKKTKKRQHADKQDSEGVYCMYHTPDLVLQLKRSMRRKEKKLKLEDWQSSETALVNHEIHIFKDIHLEDD